MMAAARSGGEAVARPGAEASQNIPAEADGGLARRDRRLDPMQAMGLARLIRNRRRRQEGADMSDSNLDLHASSDHHGAKESSIVNTFAAAIINFLLMFGLCCAYGMVMFSDNFNQRHRALGVKMNLATALLMGMLLACCSKVPVAVGGPDLNPVVFLGGFVDLIGGKIADELMLQGHPYSAISETFTCGGSSIGSASGSASARLLGGGSASGAEFCEGSHLVEHLGACENYHEQLRATVIFSTTVSSALLGLIFFCLGQFRLSKYVSYVPTSVQEAFLSCIGYKVFKYALYFCNYDMFQFLPAACVGVPLYFLKAFHIGNPAIVMPAGILIPLVIFYVIIFSIGWSIEDARVADYYFPLMDNTPFWHMWTDSWGNFGSINFDAWIATFPDLAIMLVVCVLDCMLKISLTETKLPLKTNKNYEVKLYGLGNAMMVACGSPVGYMQLKFNIIAYGVLGNVKDRKAGMLYALLCGICFLWTIALFNFMPRFFLSSLLFFAGTGFVVENLWGSRQYLNFREWVEILLILLVFIFSGQLLPAVITGIVLTSISFISHYATVSAVLGEPCKGSEVATHHRRGALVNAYVAYIADHWLLAVRLKGFVFFASVQGVTQDLLQRFNAQADWPEYRRLKYVIFDCELLDGMDVSAAKGFQSLISEANGMGIRIIFCTLKNSQRREFKKRNLMLSEDDYFSSLGEAVLYIEEHIVRYCQEKHQSFLELHPAFTHHQGLMNDVRNFGPFGEVLRSDASRFGCPLMYCKRVTIRRYETVLFCAGDQDSVLYLVHTGAVGLFLTLPDQNASVDAWGNPVMIHRHGSFLNTEWMARRPSDLNAVALEDGELIAWDKDDFNQMSRENPTMAAEILSAVMRQTHCGMAMTWGGQANQLPHELEVSLQELEGAHALQEEGFFESVSLQETAARGFPAVPKPLEQDLRNAFLNYCADRAGKSTIKFDQIGEALRYAGILYVDILDKAQDIPDTFTEADFMAVAREAAMSRFNARQVERVDTVFRETDADSSGTLDKAELVEVFRLLKRNPNVSQKEVDGVAAGWSVEGRDIGKETFLAILSRYIRKHEHRLCLLQACQEMFGEKYRSDMILTRDALASWMSRRVAEPAQEGEAATEQSQGEAATEPPQEDIVARAEELLWFADWKSNGSNLGKQVDMAGLLSAMILPLERLDGKLPTTLRSMDEAIERPAIVQAFNTNTTNNNTLVMPVRSETPTPSRSPCKRFANNSRLVEDPKNIVNLGFDASNMFFNFRTHGKGAKQMQSGWTLDEHALSERRLGDIAHLESVERAEDGLGTPSHQGGNDTIEIDIEEEEPNNNILSPAPEELTLKQKLYNLIERPRSSTAATLLSILTAVLASASVALLFASPFIDSILGEAESIDDLLWRWFSSIVTGYFTVELIVRFLVSDAYPKVDVANKYGRLDFIRSPGNICDLLAITPCYIEIVWRAEREFYLLRVVKLFRLFRVVRLQRKTFKPAQSGKNHALPPIIMVLVVIWFIYMKHSVKGGH